MLSAENHASAISQFLIKRSSAATRLRLASEADSEFLLSLRLDPTRNQNISSTSSDLAEQCSWMRSYEERYAHGKEAYFVIEVDGVPHGSLRLYDYLPEYNSFCWGSWIIRPGSPPSTAFHSAILVYDLAFGSLGFARSHFNVRQSNNSVWKFHEKMGARLAREDTSNRFYNYEVKDYRQARERLQKFTQRTDFR